MAWFLSSGGRGPRSELPGGSSPLAASLCGSGAEGHRGPPLRRYRAAVVRRGRCPSSARGRPKAAPSSSQAPYPSLPPAAKAHSFRCSDSPHRTRGCRRWASAGAPSWLPPGEKLSTVERCVRGRRWTNGTGTCPLIRHGLRPCHLPPQGEGPARQGMPRPTQEKPPLKREVAFAEQMTEGFSSLDQRNPQSPPAGGDSPLFKGAWTGAHAGAPHKKASPWGEAVERSETDEGATMDQRGG